MSNKRCYYVANATNQPISVKASDDESSLAQFAERDFNANATVGVSAAATSAVGVGVAGQIDFRRHQETFQETRSTKPGFVKIAPQKAVRFENRAYITYILDNVEHGPIDTPTKRRSLIITEDGLLKSKVLPSKPSLRHVFTEELENKCYLKPAKKSLEEDGVGCPDGDDEGNDEEFEDYDQYDD